MGKEIVRIYIKYMVSLRCKMLVKDELEKLGIHHRTLNLGTVELSEELTLEQEESLSLSLRKSGLELMDDKRSILVERVKNVIIEMIHYSEEIPRVNYSDYISKQLDHNYTYLANTFSEVKGITIQQFIILNKIERVKELILYNELNLTEIADKLDYSSVGHLSNQFKKITGLSPSFYKKLKEKRFNNLEDL